MEKTSRSVYSTESGRLCPSCGQPAAGCRCRLLSKEHQPSALPITIWRERKGRGGREVTIIKGLPLNQLELQRMASALKKHCGCGGTVNQTSIEIQGNQREKIRQYLAGEGFQAKLAGG